MLSGGVEAVLVLFSENLLAGAGDVRSCYGDGDHALDEPRRVLSSNDVIMVVMDGYGWL